MLRLNIILLFLTTTLAGCSLDWEERHYSGTLKGVDICVEKNQSELVSAITIRNRCAKKHANEILVLEPSVIKFNFDWYFGEVETPYSMKFKNDVFQSYFLAEFESSSIILVDVELTHSYLDKEGNYYSSIGSPTFPLWIEPNSFSDREVEFRFGDHAQTKIPTSCASDPTKCDGNIRLTKYSALKIIPSD